MENRRVLLVDVSTYEGYTSIDELSNHNLNVLNEPKVYKSKDISSTATIRIKKSNSTNINVQQDSGARLTQHEHKLNILWSAIPLI